MNNLFIVRHGKYDLGTGHLTREGKDDIYKLSNGIYKIIKENNVGIVSSPAARTLESAKIIADRLGIEEVISKDELFTQHNDVTSHELEKVWEIYDNIEDGYDSLVLVSHGPIVRMFSWSVRAKRFNKHKLMPAPEKGKGFYINMNNGRYRSIPKH